jgi:hypothetical protein
MATIPKTIISTPIIAALVLLAFFWLAQVVFAQTGLPGESADQTVFYWTGRVVVVGSLAAIAVSAIYNAFRKAALTEAKELAATRKEKLIEKELEIQILRNRNKDLEAENESLEKKNLRLQEGK